MNINSRLRPKIIKALELALNPEIPTMMITDFVTLLRMMPGQISSGTLPVNAIIYQFVIITTIFIVEYVGVGLILKIATIIFFTKRDILRKDSFVPL